MLKRHVVTITTIADESGIGYTPEIKGFLHSIRYIRAAADFFTDGVNFTITGKDTGQTLWTQNTINASTIRFPRVPIHDTAGVAITGGYGNPILMEAVKIAVAGGGVAKVGTFEVVVDDLPNR